MYIDFVRKTLQSLRAVGATSVWEQKDSNSTDANASICAGAQTPGLAWNGRHAGPEMPAYMAA